MKHGPWSIFFSIDFLPSNSNNFQTPSDKMGHGELGDPAACGQPGATEFKGRHVWSDVAAVAPA